MIGDEHIPDYDWYKDEYRGREGQKAFEEGLPHAVAVVSDLVGFNEVDERTDKACRRAICAACDVFATYGYGPMGGFTIGSFSVQGDATKHSVSLAMSEARRELAASGLLWAGASRW